MQLFLKWFLRLKKDNLLEKELNGVCVSTETEELGIYKSFNYEIF